MGFVNLFTEVAQCNCYVERFVRSVGNVTGNPGQGAYDRGFVQLASLFLKGKILYTPDNNITRNIINQVRLTMTSQIEFIIIISKVRATAISFTALQTAPLES